jgi:hypothetical protein
MYAHRVAWILAHGSIPAGLEIGHTCHNSRCCNASHLHPCTHTENNRESADAGNFRVARPSGHKVTTEQLAEIDALLAVGGRGTKAEIARRYGVTKAWVSQYAKGQRRQYDRPAQRRKAVA